MIMCFFIRSFSMVPVAFWYIGVFVSTLFYPVQRNINKKSLRTNAENAGRTKKTDVYLGIAGVTCSLCFFDA